MNKPESLTYKDLLNRFLAEADDDLLDNAEAARALGCSPNTLNNSRTTGKLAGVDAPPHKKFGRSVRYRRGTLKDWKAQFKEHISTSSHDLAA